MDFIMAFSANLLFPRRAPDLLFSGVVARCFRQNRDTLGVISFYAGGKTSWNSPGYALWTRRKLF